MSRAARPARLVHIAALIPFFILLLAVPAASAREHKLSLAQCIKLALEASHQLRITRFKRQQAQLTIQAERGAFFPTIGSTLSFHRGVGATPYAYSDADGLYDLTTFNYGAEISGLLPTGTTYDLQLGSQVTWTNMSGNLFSPQHVNALTLTVGQPVLRGWGLENTLGELHAARVDLKVSQQEHRAQINLLLRAVVLAYWNLADRLAQLTVARQSLALARGLQELIQKRVTSGTMSRLELVEAKAAVAVRREAMLAARQAVKSAENGLLLLLYSENKKGGNALGLEHSIVPTDQPRLESEARPLDQLVRRALEQRPLVKAASLRVKSQAISLTVAQNQSMPKLDVELQGGFESLAGSVSCDPKDASCTPVEFMKGGHGTAWGQVFTAKIPFVKLGLSFELPLSGDVRRQKEQKARLLHKQLQASLRQQRVAVALEVRGAYLKQRSATRRIGAVTEQLSLAKQNLTAAEQKFKNGLCDSYYVLRVQLELGKAHIALARAHKDQVVARAELEAAVGALPEYLGIKLH